MIDDCLHYSIAIIGLSARFHSRNQPYQSRPLHCIRILFLLQ
nr:MAG TPA: hypothetical protein [Caudoviricetes sp.]